MARYVFRLPDTGEGTTEAEISAWHVAVGDRVGEDDPLVDVMTDKATVEIPSPVTGTVVSLRGTPGEKVPVGSELVVLELDGDAESPAVAAPPEPAAEPVPAAPPQSPPSPPPPRPAAAPAVPRRPLASPATRRRALERGIDLRLVRGSGPAGRITPDDLERHATAAEPAPAARGPAMPPRDEVTEVPVTGLRRAIAERMQEAKRHIPHFSYIEEVDVTALEELRQHLNARHAAGAEAARPRLTLLPFLVRALVRALPGWPQLNARFDDDAGVVHRHAAVHAGVATQTPNGLLVPVLRHAEALGLWDAAARIAALAAAAREGKASRAELSGSTITITSLGALGGLATTPIINRPEVAIVGVNRIVERPVVRQGQVVVRRMMNLSCSFDHRVVDGWDAAAFVQRLRELLEQPAILFMEEP